MSFRRAAAVDWPSAFALLKQANHPPLYEWVLLRPWLHVGSQDFVLRYLSVVFGMLAVGLVFVLGTTVFQQNHGGDFCPFVGPSLRSMFITRAKSECTLC